MKTSLYTTLLLVIGIIVVINLLGHEYHLRLDLTEDKQYTLSDATQRILEDLDEPVTVKAWFSQDLPPNIQRTRQDFQDLLIEYVNLSDGQLVYEFINPNEREGYEQEAVQSGIRPVLINVREKDQVKQQKAFLGATIHLGEKTEVVPFLQPGAAMEYALSTAIKKIAIEDKPVVGFVSGHGEPALAEMQQVNEQLSVLYETRSIDLADSAAISEEIRTIALIRPTDSIPEGHLRQLDKFLESGGSLLVAMNSVDADFRSRYGSAVDVGLKPWLRSKGIEVVDNFVVDAQCGAVSVPQQLGIFTVHENVSFPFVPIISTFADHAITSGLESVMLEFASELKFSGDSAKRFHPLAFTSEQSNALAAPQFFDINKEWRETDFPREHIPVAAAIETDQSKIVVIADGDFPISGSGQQARNLQPDNVNLFSNAIDWLSDDTGLIDLRTKGVAFRPLREIEDSTQAILKYTNFLLPILLVIAYGIIRAHNNRLTRLKRMSDHYEL